MIKTLKNYYLFFILLSLFVIIRILKTGFVQDYLEITTVKPNELFGLIIGATASIIGIVIAVILLSFDLSKGGFSRRQNDNILNTPAVINMVSLFMMIMILSTLCYVRIKNFAYANDLTTGYLMLALFIAFLICLFPAIRRILDTTNLLKRTLTEISNIQMEDFAEVIQLQWDKFSFNDDDKRLIRIRQQLIIYIRDHDYEAYTNTLMAINRRAILLIGDGVDRRRTDSIVEAQCFLWDSAQNEALRIQNIQFFNTVWECMEQLFEYGAVKKIPLMFFNPLDFFTSNYINFLKRNELKEPLFKGVEVLANSFKLNLKNNCPPQERLDDLYDKYEGNQTMTHYIDESIQWSDILNFLMDLFSIQASAIELNDGDLFHKCDFELSHLYLDIHQSNYTTLGIYQEADIFEQIFRIRTDNESAASRSKQFPERLSAFGMESSHIAELAERNKFYVAGVMQILSDFIIKQEYEEFLSAGLLNFWAAIGRHLSKHYLKNKLTAKTFDYVLETLIYLKSHIELHHFSSRQAIYKEVEKQTLSLKKYLERDYPKKRMPIKSSINKILKDFKPVTETTPYDIIKW